MCHFTGTTYWCWISFLRLWTTRKLNKRRPMKLLDYLVSAQKGANATPIWKITAFLLQYFIIFLYSCRWYWWSDGSVYRSQCLDNIGDIWLFVWGPLGSCSSNLFFSRNVLKITNNFRTVYNKQYIKRMCHHFSFCRFLRTKCWDIFYARDGHIGALVTIW